MYRCICAFAGILIVSASAAAVLVDDFEGYAPGQVDAVTTNWVGTADVTIETDPDDPDNQVIRLWENTGTQKAVYGILSPEASIPNGATKTLFFRLRATSAMDSAFGLTNVDTPDVGGNDWGAIWPSGQRSRRQFPRAGRWSVARRAALHAIGMAQRMDGGR